MNTEAVEHYRRSNGKFPMYSSVGSYPVLYVAGDGDCLCGNCVTELSTSEDLGPSFTITSACVHWEGPSLYCGECGKELESAYGDDTI